MISFVYKGKVQYATSIEDFYGFMDNSVFDGLKEFFEYQMSEAKSDAYEEGYDAGSRDNCDFDDDDDEDYEIANLSLMQEIEELNDKALELESEKTHILETIDTALRDYAYTNNVDGLTNRLEDLL